MVNGRQHSELGRDSSFLLMSQTTKGVGTYFLKTLKSSTTKMNERKKVKERQNE
jgi:hypothetical protein